VSAKPDLTRPRTALSHAKLALDTGGNKVLIFDPLIHETESLLKRLQPGDRIWAISLLRDAYLRSARSREAHFPKPIDEIARKPVTAPEGNPESGRN